MIRKGLLGIPVTRRTDGHGVPEGCGTRAFTEQTKDESTTTFRWNKNTRKGNHNLSEVRKKNVRLPYS